MPDPDDIPVGRDRGAQLFGDKYRAMLSARAPNGYRQIAFAFAAIARQ